MNGMEVQGMGFPAFRKMFVLRPHSGYHGTMSETAAVEISASASYGVQRIIWSFATDPRQRQLTTYSPVHDTGYKLEGLLATQDGLVLEKGRAKGTMETEAVGAPPFDWLVPWWNADTAGQGFIEIFLQAETEAGWSPWYPMGHWSQAAFSSSGGDGIAKVDTDTLVLASKAGRFKLRVELSSGEDGGGDAILRRLGIISRDRVMERPPTRHYLLQESSIPVPCRSQKIEAAGIRGRICSPTCAAMALQSHGIVLPTAFVAADCYDAGAKIYGNWPFNVASLWRLGARAMLDFFPNMEMAAAVLASGRILIASIKFAEGQLSGAPIQKTSGHLVLLTGLRKEKSGEFVVLVNDPAASHPQDVRRQYKLAEFESAWAGVAYVIEGRR